MSAIRVLVADDQADVRSALRLLLEQELGAEVEVFEVASVRRLTAMARASAAEIVLLDWEMPGLRAGACCSPAGRNIADLHRLRPAIRVVALSGRPESRSAALAEGADMFISKAEPPEGLLAVVRNALTTGSPPGS